MTNGILERIPDIASIASAGASLETDVGALLGNFGSLGPENPASPVANVFGVFAELRAKLDIDVSLFTEQLPDTMRVIQDALPANTLSYVESIDAAYTSVKDLLQDSALAQQVTAERSLQQVALA